MEQLAYKRCVSAVRKRLIYYTGWPRKNATLKINNFKKTRDRMNKLCALLRIQFFSQQDGTKMLILMKAFWFCGRFSEAMSFSRFALLSQKPQFTYRNFSILWLWPRAKCLLLLCKAKPAWIKRSIHNVTVQQITIRGSYSKKVLPTSNVTFDTKGANFKNDIASEKWLWNQNAFIICHFAGKRRFYSLMHSLTWYSPWFLWN